MLYINPEDNTIKEALESHFKAVRCYIWKKIGAKDCTGQTKKCAENCPICRSRIQKVKNLPNSLYNIFNDDAFLHNLLCAKPSELVGLHKLFWSKLFPGLPYENWIFKVNPNFYKKDILPKYEHRYLNIAKAVQNSLLKIISYDNWFVSNSPSEYYGAYHLAQNLGIQSCTYCNRTYTATVLKNSGGKLTRPQFDHYFPQSIFPLLALSFYNLIPSCYICNSSIKKDIVFNLDTHIHPYVDDVTDMYAYTYDYQLSKNRYSIDFKIANHNEIKPKIKKTIEDFHLKEIFESHQSELDDLVKTRLKYSKDYLMKLKGTFPLANLTEKEMYRLAFGVELNQDDFHKRPLSKFKSDILKELGIIK